MREAHFTSSLLLALVLVFFAATGFMAQHREWFHPRVDRGDLASGINDRECTSDALADAAGAAPLAVEQLGSWRLVDSSDGSHRLACQTGSTGHQQGEIQPWPAGVDLGAAPWRVHHEQREQHRIEPWHALPAASDTAWFRTSSVWRVRSLEVDPARARIVVWDLPLPLAMSLIEIHRGRGVTDLLVDLGAVLVLFVALTGVLHGLRYPGAKRRILWVMLVGSAAIVAGLLLG